MHIYEFFIIFHSFGDKRYKNFKALPPQVFTRCEISIWFCLKEIPIHCLNLLPLSPVYNFERTLANKLKTAKFLKSIK